VFAAATLAAGNVIRTAWNAHYVPTYASTTWCHRSWTKPGLGLITDWLFRQGKSEILTVSAVRSGPHDSLPTSWRGTCKRPSSRQAVLLNTSACQKTAKWQQEM